MRDDAAAVFERLARHYAEKLRDVNRLLLSEQDKLHHFKSGNIEKILELIESDNAIIDLIDLSDFEIARGEDSLARIMGTTRDGMYDQPVVAELADLIAQRNSIGKKIGQVFENRGILAGLLESEHEKLREDIDGISRINRLKRFVPE